MRKGLKLAFGLTLGLTLGAVAATPSLAETGVTDSTIKIGIFAPLTGNASIFGQYAVGVRAYYKMINDQGGVDGRKIQVFMEDGACDPATTVAATKRLVSQDGVFALHAGVCTADIMAIKKDMERQGIPFMNLGAAGNALTNPLAKNLFSALPNTEVVGQTLVDFAMSKPGAKRLAVISHPDDWGKSQLDPAIKLLKDKYHAEFVANVTMERGATDITPQILKLRAAKPDVVLSFLYPTETAIFVRSAAKYALTAPLLTCFGAPYEDTISRVADPAATKNLYVFHALNAPATSPELAKWADMVHKYEGKDVKIGDYVLSGIGGAEVVVAALKKAGHDLTREKFIQALDSIKDFDTHLLSAPVSFSPQDHAGVKSGAMMTQVDGKVVSVTSWPKGKD
jgi:branched-chain amino acid transport system substrate-binding protein